MLERRLLMLGTENFEDSIKGIDIINRDKRNFLDGHIKFCNIHGIENDTTGTASHFVSEFAIVNAIKELFEKNSLFLFWFKQRGFKVSNSGNFINTYFKEKYKNIYLFLNDDFSPFICCTAFAIDKNEIIANGSGISFNLEFSIQNALEELDLLYEQKK
ncbi:hypothetical protein EGM85_08765 [Macrococcus caseolyticus]|nr:hypothetical protein [Macrococcus caseolyticus]RKO14000.1 hypothetical protein D6861_08765 [Macrococcus caseolyticus]